MTNIQLKYFIDICLSGSITKAAKQNQVTQPTISEAIKKLEAELGCKLIERRGRGFSLTKNGELFRPHAQELIAHHNLILEKMRELSGESRLVRLGVPYLISADLLPEIHEQCEKVSSFSLCITEGTTHRILQMAKGGQIDIALLNKSSLDYEPTKDFQYYTLKARRTSKTFCIHKKRRLEQKNGEVLKWTSLKNIPLAVNSNALNSELYLNLMRSSGIVPDIIIESPQISTIQSFVRKGLAGTFLPKEYFKDEKDIFFYYLPDNAPDTPVCIIWKRNELLSPAVRRFIDLMKKL